MVRVLECSLALGGGTKDGGKLRRRRGVALWSCLVLSSKGGLGGLLRARRWAFAALLGQGG